MTRCWIPLWFPLIYVVSCLFSAIETAEYGADVSFPIHHKDLHEGPLGNRNAFYQEFMNGCRELYGEDGYQCDMNEDYRLAMNLRQPQSMVNYSSTGFMKIPAPKHVRELLESYWAKNKDNRVEEIRPVGNIYVSNWKAKSYMISVEDSNLRGGGFQLKSAIWDAARTTVEQWTGLELNPISLYGIRVYTEGAMLAPHVDRLPLVSSCIVNVAQDVDEPWPLEVYDYEGNAVNVTMEPGDMVLYESHSVIHGRPFPLKGRFFANIFIHFEPTGRKLADLKDNQHANEDGSFFPPYIIPGSPEIENWKSQHPFGWTRNDEASLKSHKPRGHAAAAEGDIDTLMALAKENRQRLHEQDQNGWEPLHEAVRAGHIDAVKLLLEHDADINARTHFGAGMSPLNLALQSLDEKHPVTLFLIDNGALDIEKEL